MGGLARYAPRWLTSNQITAASGPNRRENNWVDGLRGIASIIVVGGHLVSGWAIYLHKPAWEENGPTLLFQYPFLRLVIGGRGSVAIFFIVTGYVNSLNPIKNFRANNVGPSLIHLSKSTFTRVGRLMLPTMIATLCSWFCVHTGLYNMATRIDCNWYNHSSTYNETFRESFAWLFNNFTLFWNTSRSHYDSYHWTMAYIMAASFRVYLVLLFMAFLKRRYCYVVTALLYWFAWRTEDYFIGLNVMVGIFFAQLHRDLGHRALSLVPRPIPFLAIILGLFIWSYPLNEPQWAGWSLTMQKIMRAIGPEEQDVISRFWVSVGPTILILGITFSRGAQWFLKLPLFNFLGRISYAIYLLHHTLIRTVLIWALYGHAAFTTPKFNEKGEKIILQAPSRAVFIIVVPIFFMVLCTVAHFWTVYVDSFCAKVVARVKRHVFRDEDELEKTIPLTSMTSRS